MSPSKPHHSLDVVLLAFANTDGLRRLDHLGREEELIRNALDPLVNAGHIDRPVTLWNATPDRIIDEFQRDHLRGRISVFHFAGHAGPAHVLLAGLDRASVAAPAEHLAEYLGRQEGLELVFLNGCSTEPQVDLLLAAGIKAVIATSAPVGDEVAADFAVRFYAELRARPLGEAFLTAKAAVNLTRGGIARDLKREPAIGHEEHGKRWRLRCDRPQEAWVLGDRRSKQADIRVVPPRWGSSWPTARFSISNQTDGPIQITEIRGIRVACCEPFKALFGRSASATAQRVHLAFELDRTREGNVDILFGEDEVSNLAPGCAEAFGLTIDAENSAGIVDMELTWLDAEANEHVLLPAYVLLVHAPLGREAGAIDALPRARGLEVLLRREPPNAWRERSYRDDVSFRLLLRAAARLCVPDLDDGFERLAKAHERDDGWPPILASFAEAIADGLSAPRAADYLDALFLDADRVRALVSDEEHYARTIVHARLKTGSDRVDWAFAVLDATLPVTPVPLHELYNDGLLSTHDELLEYLGERLGHTIDEIHVARALLMGAPSVIPWRIVRGFIADSGELRRWWTANEPHLRADRAWRERMPRFAASAIPVLEASHEP